MFIYKVQENNLGIIVCRVDTNENIEYRYFQGLLSYPIHDKLKLLKSYDQIQEYLKTLFEWSYFFLWYNLEKCQKKISFNAMLSIKIVWLKAIGKVFCLA